MFVWGKYQQELIKTPKLFESKDFDDHYQQIFFNKTTWFTSSKEIEVYRIRKTIASDPL